MSARKVLKHKTGGGLAGVKVCIGVIQVAGAGKPDSSVVRFRGKGPDKQRDFRSPDRGSIPNSRG